MSVTPAYLPNHPGEIPRAGQPLRTCPARSNEPPGHATREAVDCNQHGRTGWDRWKRAEEGAQRSRGYGSQWRRARAAALERAGNRCEVCGATGELEVHHIDGRSPLEPGANAASNLLVVCRRDHRLAEVERRRAQA
jgi:5-methylcytosine-specific restriction endonuclease McrA